MSIFSSPANLSEQSYGFPSVPSTMTNLWESSNEVKSNAAPIFRSVRRHSLLDSNFLMGWEETLATMQRENREGHLSRAQHFKGDGLTSQEMKSTSSTARSLVAFSSMYNDSEKSNTDESPLFSPKENYGATIKFSAPSKGNVDPKGVHSLTSPPSSSTLSGSLRPRSRRCYSPPVEVYTPTSHFIQGKYSELEECPVRRMTYAIPNTSGKCFMPFFKETKAVPKNKILKPPESKMIENALPVHREKLLNTVPSLRTIQEKSTDFSKKSSLSAFSSRKSRSVNRSNVILSRSVLSKPKEISNSPRNSIFPTSQSSPIKLNRVYPTDSNVHPKKGGMNGESMRNVREEPIYCRLATHDDKVAECAAKKSIVADSNSPNSLTAPSSVRRNNLEGKEKNFDSPSDLSCNSSIRVEPVSHTKFPKSLEKNEASLSQVSSSLTKRRVSTSMAHVKSKKISTSTTLTPPQLKKKDNLSSQTTLQSLNKHEDCGVSLHETRRSTRPAVDFSQTTTKRLSPVVKCVITRRPLQKNGLYDKTSKNFTKKDHTKKLENQSVALKNPKKNSPRDNSSNRWSIFSSAPSIPRSCSYSLRDLASQASISSVRSISSIRSMEVNLSHDLHLVDSAKNSEIQGKPSLVNTIPLSVSLIHPSKKKKEFPKKIIGKIDKTGGGIELKDKAYSETNSAYSKKNPLSESSIASSESVWVTFCIECGNKYFEVARFCHFCGHKRELLYL